MNHIKDIAQEWRVLLEPEFDKPYFKELTAFLEREYRDHTVFPSKEKIYRAFELCPPERIKVVIIGQDPYHGVGQANGLAFSVEDGIKHPPSLVNIFKEVVAEGYSPIPESGELERWAQQGVLLINSVLTVRAHEPASHASKGWEKFTDAIIEIINRERSSVVYMLWGGYAQRKAAIVDRKRNLVINSVHPSPLSSYRGWFDSGIFQKANSYLQSNSIEQIKW